MVTIMECGQQIRLVWINSALVRLSELQEALELQVMQRSKLPSAPDIGQAVSASSALKPFDS
jgi:hypothetical protein